MQIGCKQFKEIQVIGKENELLALITDKDIIEKDDITVVCVPEENLA